ncbi:type II toxin-antitoxin system RelE/ParE family toxin [Dyadobacter sp. CY323]|uniref:type II toxin-antitoxin system RelE/ParE family toxin n=1 Tax=Dyadobacter sp. CY323 TaxID=2907302 RepID=UPI001F3AF1B1|nr:type II toxin-antitoxin system RelE/ParE family toxin [Dyadobacter sp. CY323]MCE6990386.1 type II toxin-antitoxin system RelE/ParE family toxin [Dyadobacter sp. CY323]
MNFEVTASDHFIKNLKRLVKKYASLKDEIAELANNLTKDPSQGTPLGKSCFKIRLSIKSKGRGKSGGARVITCVFALKHTVVLLSIYDKAEKENIKDHELEELIRNVDAD